MSNYDIKELQKYELDILLEVDRICKKYNITYFLIAGTLLGAIRHKGFIPWDDDIDICMPIKDSRKFCKVGKKEISQEYFIQTYKTDIIATWFGKVRKNGTTAIESHRMKNKLHQGIWIDIFPLIGICDDKKWIDVTTKKALFGKWLINKKVGVFEHDGRLPFYMHVHKLVPFALLRGIADLLYQSAFKDHKMYDLCTYLWGKSSIKGKFKSVWFDETCDVQFEGHVFPAPINWDEYLTAEYGDYMTPPPPEKRNGGSHTISIIDLHNDYTKYIPR